MFTSKLFGLRRAAASVATRPMPVARLPVARAFSEVRRLGALLREREVVGPPQRLCQPAAAMVILFCACGSCVPLY